MSAPVDVLAVMDSLEWGFMFRRCPICAGWHCGPNGETDFAHTKSCPFPTARAAVAELIKATENHLESLDAWDGNPVPINRNRGTAAALRAALARVGGAS